jgi:hypothetical protein
MGSRLPLNGEERNDRHLCAHENLPDMRSGFLIKAIDCLSTLPHP